MSILVWFVTGLAAALFIHFLMPRSGVGGTIGDMLLGVIGAGFGAYMVYTYNMGHWLDDYLLWVGVVGFSAAAGMLIFVHTLSMKHPESRDADEEDMLPV